ncbi:hypothetical protein NC652_020941 [Populus alba x Populus x berolinensis]|nr:hypothetical protein NC652_020941 [Populus alba x Populus x berolinensis]
MQDHGLTERGPPFWALLVHRVIDVSYPRMILFGLTANLDGTDYLGTLDPSCEATASYPRMPDKAEIF